MWYTITLTLSLNSLDLDVYMQTLDTGVVHSMHALLDCGASELFINTVFVARNKLTMKPLSCPILVYNIDSSPNEAGSICEIVELVP